MSDAKLPVNLPQLEDPEKDKVFRKHAIALSIVMCASVNKYLKTLPEDQAPNALSIGAACYIASYLIGLNFLDERKTQVEEGLELCLALNKDNGSSLANLPPKTTPLN